ncbi:MAG TPA: alpha-L-fucosidase [Phnomibacter sp.]|nr:alpha-L-fucosidase [Phnomibacter sp.]
MKQSFKTFAVVLLLASSFQLSAQTYTPAPANLAARKEFQDDKFGMFIHWGASSVLGNGEWVMTNRNIKVQDYNRLINFFNPQDFDAAKWVGIAKAAGMKYITFITRHHDSFSNWDTKQSDWKITNTPYGKDVLKQLADECHKQGIKLYCYYSLLDWYRSDYQYETGKTGRGTGRTEKSNWDSYIRFMKAQLTELLTNYGEISGIWFDGHWDQVDNDANGKPKSKVDWRYNEIYELIHKLQPQCLISNNHHLAPIPGEDFQAFEKDLPGHNTSGFGGAAVSTLPLETCETMNDSWGYNITDRNYKSTKKLVQFMVKAACYNANLLLNIGPMPNGDVQPEFRDTLAKMGAWMNKYGTTIYGTRGAITAPKNWGGFTQKGKTVYMHILNKPEEGNYIFIPELKEKIKTAVMLDNKTAVKFKQLPEGTFIYLDNIAFEDWDTILELQLN